MMPLDDTQLIRGTKVKPDPESDTKVQIAGTLTGDFVNTSSNNRLWVVRDSDGDIDFIGQDSLTENYVVDDGTSNVTSINGDATSDPVPPAA